MIYRTACKMLSFFKRIAAYIKAIVMLRKILELHHGGVLKRIAENRELLELLYEDSAFLSKHSWVEDWLLCNDKFLDQIATLFNVTEGRIRREHIPSLPSKRNVSHFNASCDMTDLLNHPLGKDAKRQLLDNMNLKIKLRISDP